MRIIFCLIGLSVLAGASFAREGNDTSQAFLSGDWTISGSASLGYYRYSTLLKSTAERDSNGALSRMYQVGFEKGIRCWLSAGLKGKFNRYFTEPNKITGKIPVVKSDDVLLFLHAYFLNRRHFVMAAGLGFGISSFVYEANDSRISRASGRGPNVELCLQPRFAFGRHFGAYLLLSYNRLKYSSLSFEDQLTYLPDVLALEGAGTAFGVGMFFRIGTK